MKFQQLRYALIGALVLNACSDETTIYQDNLQDEVFLENSSAVLDGAVSFGTSGVLDIFDENGASGKSADVAGDYPLTLVASVSPPSYRSGDNLTASHVQLDGSFVYVAYNTVGEEYYGAIDIVNISDPHNPRVTSRLFYLNTHVNALKFENGYIYAVGGVNAETSVTATANSFLARIPASGGRLSTDGILYGFQEGYNAADVLVQADRILVSSGKEGSITAYSKTDLTKLGETFVADARSMAATDAGFAVLDAGSGVRLLQQDFSETALVPVTTDLGLATKKTLDIQQGRIMVAEAALGAGIYDAATGNLMEYLPIPIHPDGTDQADVVTNAVVANEEAVFMANGGAGMCLSAFEGDQARLVGIIELQGSVNYVASRDDYVFAATGEGGLQVIRIHRPSESLAGSCEGLPEYDGSSKMTVNSGQSAAFSGAKRLNNMNIGGELLLCGAWTVSNSVNLQPGGRFDLFGTLAVGRFNRRRNITVNEGSVLRIEGDVTIYGDLILNDGATLEFLGEDSAIDIFGQVKVAGDVTITGNFRDVRNKF